MNIDLVLEGGGVKGIGVIGAYHALEKAGYRVNRTAGASAGAIMASMIAAGYSAAELKEVADTIDYKKVADLGLVDRFGIAGKSFSVLFEKGVYEGNYIRQLVFDLLDRKGIRTFGDLRIKNPDSSDPKDAYSLVIIVTDVTRSKLIRLPWDYHEYGLDPDTQLIADAVRGSVAVPFYYEPVRLGDSYIVDGGITANFPIGVFENGQHQHSETRPIFGVKLSARETARDMDHIEKTSNTFEYAFSILSTMINNQDQVHLNDPCTLQRTIFVDADDISFIDFSITPEKQQRLYQNGLTAAEKFLETWDYQKFLSHCSEH